MAGSFPTTVADRDLWLKQGRLLEFPDVMPSGMAPALWNALRNIPADLIRANFDPVSRASSVGLLLHNVEITGSLRLINRIIYHDVRITNSTIVDELDWSRIQCNGRVNLSGTVFKKEARFVAAGFSHDFLVSNSDFEGESFFDLIKVADLFDARGAHFTGKASFRSCHFSEMAQFAASTTETGAIVRRMEFCDNVLFHESRFDRSAIFEAVHFNKDVNFSRIVVGGNFFLRTAYVREWNKFGLLCCDGDLTLMDVVVNGAADLNGLNVAGKATLTRMKAGGGLFCRVLQENGKHVRPRFRGDAFLDNIRVSGRTTFSGATFEGNITFAGSRLEGDAYFNAAWKTRFRFEVRKEADFRGVSIDGLADFTAARFTKEAHFERSRFGGNLYFGSATEPAVLRPVFAGAAIFNDVSVAGSASFTGAIFLKETSFRRMQVQSAAYFGGIDIDMDRGCARTVFRDKSFFTEVRFGGTAFFNAAQFRGSTTWDRASIGSSLSFSPVGNACARFWANIDFRDGEVKGVVDFTRARLRKLSLNRTRIASTVNLSDAQIANGLLLVDAQVQTLSLGDSAGDYARLPSKPAVDLRGLVFSRFSGNWPDLVSRLPSDQFQPYVQLEKHFRSAADQGEADRVYVARRCQERRELGERISMSRKSSGKKKFKPGESTAKLRWEWIQNWALDYFFYYGLPCWRHILLAGVLVLASIGLFLAPESLEPKTTPHGNLSGRERVYASVGAGLINLIPGEHAGELGSWEISKHAKPVPRGWTFFQWAAFFRYATYALVGIGATQLASLKKRH
jgi:uncharacterized protein YjbI with pentapeptide repeats